MDILNFVKFSAPGTVSTATFARSVDVAQSEISSLIIHLDHCRAERSALFALRCACETLHGVLRGRFITVVTVAALVIATSAVVL